MAGRARRDAARNEHDARGKERAGREGRRGRQPSRRARPAAGDNIHPATADNCRPHAAAAPTGNKIPPVSDGHTVNATPRRAAQAAPSSRRPRRRYYATPLAAPSPQGSNSDPAQDGHAVAKTPPRRAKATAHQGPPPFTTGQYDSAHRSTLRRHRPDSEDELQDDAAEPFILCRRPPSRTMTRTRM